MRSLALFLVVVQALGHCPWPNGGQFECHTTPSQKNVTIFEVASQYHAHPMRVCDYNTPALTAAECYGTVPLRRNLTLRVPQGACEPMPGILCYEVQEHNETLESIAYSTNSVFRSVDRILLHNKHVLWGQKTVFKGMQLRLPNPMCVPDHGDPDNVLICHTVKEGENLSSIAEYYETDRHTVQKLNSERLGLSYPHNQQAVLGMQLQVPHPHPKPDHTKPCEPDKWGGFWSCYDVPDKKGKTILKGQTIIEIADTLQIEPWVLCQANPNIDCTPGLYCNGTFPPSTNMSNCSVLIQPTSETGYPIFYPYTTCDQQSDDDSYSCYITPTTNLADSEVRMQAPLLHTRGPDSISFNYKTGKGTTSDTDYNQKAEQWYQDYMNLNANSLTDKQDRFDFWDWDGTVAPDTEWKVCCYAEFTPPYYYSCTDGCTGEVMTLQQCMIAMREHDPSSVGTCKSCAGQTEVDCPPFGARQINQCLVRNDENNTQFVSIDDCIWPLNSAVKVPNLAACASSDPNACYTITEDDVKAVRKYERCQKNSFYNNSCQWDGQNLNAKLVLSFMDGAAVRTFGRRKPFISDFIPPGCVAAEEDAGIYHLCSAVLPENRLVNFDFAESQDLPVGAQYVMPNPQMIAGGTENDWSRRSPHTQYCEKGCCAVPANSIPLQQCDLIPGDHWCYRIQKFTAANSTQQSWGDYLWNVSQNVPSEPIGCSVDSEGKPLNCPLCPAGVGSDNCPKNPEPGCPLSPNGCNNCNYIVEQAAVPINITRPPPPSGHECHTTAPAGCNVCQACCSDFIPDGAECDHCFAVNC